METPRSLEEVTVRGREAGSFVSQARIEDSPREITDAASLVEPLPGVHVRRLGADDSFATLSIRGTSSTQVAIYLAGVPLSGGADPTLDLATLPLWPGVRARVYRSFAPAALGRGSLGGTLVLDPPSARGPTTTDVWAAAGSYGSRRLRVGDVRGEDDGFRIATGISASRAGDDFTYVDPNSNAPVRRVNSGHAAASGIVSFGLPVRLGATKTGALTVTTLAQARHQEIPGTVSVPTPYQTLDSTRLLEAIELTVPFGAGTFGVRGWGRREGTSNHDASSEAKKFGLPSSTNDAILATGASVGWKTRPSEGSTIETRVDGSLERFSPGEWVDQPQPTGARRSNVGLAFDGTMRVARPLVLAASGRADGWFDSSDDGSSSSSFRPTGHLGLESVLGPIALATHGGYVARPPSFSERFGRGAFIGNPEVRPEEATTVDAGARFDRRFGPLRLHAEVAGFSTWASDLIVFVPQGAYGRAKATNIGRARLYGVEAEVNAGIAGFEARVSQTSMATVNESDCHYVNQVCERPGLPGRPEQDFVLDLAYTVGPVRVRYGFDFVSGIQTDAKGDENNMVPARALHSAGARLSVPGVPGLDVALDLRNLFDLRVAEYAGVLGPVQKPIGDLYDYPLPGRRFLLSVRWTSPPPHRSDP
ncbi:TonB-dependent receptor plug domain-containing protein [Labilithrix luteola]|uniref:TonB-dependent receptor plug domain-containing protein n=1 Tax=Labilithrix luteola TaxID=1391654 RepID=UPI0014754EA1|nr:TonB-dependent receptor [Labilithrix luteola]